MDTQVRIAGTAEIGVTGLAVMGVPTSPRNIAANGFVNAIHNRSAARTTALIAEHFTDDAAEQIADAKALLDADRINQAAFDAPRGKGARLTRSARAAGSTTAPRSGI
ncbi:MAG TPA: NAD(P)-binding domain-containing protein [Aldersonia sp.]